MSLILNIDTALETATVSLAKEGALLLSAINPEQKNHASWLHPAINDIFKKTGINFQDLSAVAVSNGPGSYTGLRVGLSTAKGFCYALNKPLIVIGTLEIMANAVKANAIDLICPLIDARRMEVYSALYDHNCVEIIPPHVEELNENSFSELLNSTHVIFCGSGMKKIQTLFKHPPGNFIDMGTIMPAFSQLSYNEFIGKKFADIAYTEPLYIKEFYSAPRKE